MTKLLNGFEQGKQVFRYECNCCKKEFPLEDLQIIPAWNERRKRAYDSHLCKACDSRLQAEAEAANAAEVARINAAFDAEDVCDTTGNIISIKNKLDETKRQALIEAKGDFVHA